MSVLIKNMEMPCECGACRFCEAYDKGLFCANLLMHIKERRERINDCPLVGLPEDHGDLVDMDYIKRHWPNVQYFGAPVIVPAERSESDARPEI